MDAEIEALSLNNAAPSEEAEQETKKLILKNVEDLKNLDSEIVNLESRLHDLKIKRDTTQRKIRRCQSILSPLRRMSPEILGEIFSRCLSTHRNPLITTADCPLLLTHVCSFWRAAATSEPRLWERIHITIGDSFGDYNSRSRQRLLKILRRKLEAVRKWISRSGTRPLSVSVCFTARWMWHSFPRAERRALCKIFGYIASISSRFKDLELSMALLAYYVLESRMDVSTMTTLASLRVDLGCDYEDDISGPIALLKAPNLKDISISTNGPGMLGIGDPSITPTWGRLRALSFHNTMKITLFRNSLTPTQLLFLLQHSPNLVHFKAILRKHKEEDSAAQTSDERISLPFLRTFSIKDDVPPNAAQNLGMYARINAPGITWVEYSGTLDSIDLEGNEADCSIVALLERLPALKKLTINCEYLDQRPGGFNILWSMFRAVPSITHLFLGSEERSPSGSLVRFPPGHVSRTWRGMELFGLQLRRLRVPRSYNRNDHDIDPDSHDDPPPLPNLTTLEISSRTMFISDQDIIKFVVSRMNPALFLPSSSESESESSRASGSGSGSRCGIARLKHVGVVFYRQKMLDVEAKIREYAERVGTDMIDLVLDYPEPPPGTKMKAHAPGYGLRDWDGRSWHYRDAEDFTASDAVVSQSE